MGRSVPLQLGRLCWPACGVVEYTALQQREGFRPRGGVNPQAFQCLIFEVLGGGSGKNENEYQAWSADGHLEA